MAQEIRPGSSRGRAAEMQPTQTASSYPGTGKLTLDAQQPAGSELPALSRSSREASSTSAARTASPVLAVAASAAGGMSSLAPATQDDTIAPAPPTASAMPTAEALRPDQREAKALIQQATPLIQAMSGKSARIRNRRLTLTSSLRFPKPDSEQYHHAKDLSLADRALLSSALEAIVISDAESRDKALEMLQSVHHAQLRTHSPGSTAAFHQANKDRIKDMFTFSVIVPLPDLLSIASAPRSLRKSRKEYYRNDDRPSYIAAFNGAMDLMASPHLTDEQARNVARMFLDQHIRTEETIRPADVNPLLEFVISKTGQPAGRAGFSVDAHQTVKPPARGTAEQELALLDAIIDYAKIGNRAFEVITDIPEFYATLEAIKGDEKWNEIGFFNNKTECIISTDKLSAGGVGMPVALFNPEGQGIGFYRLAQLIQWMNSPASKGMDPQKTIQLNPGSLRKYCRRLELEDMASVAGPSESA